MSMVVARSIGIDFGRNALVVEWYGEGPAGQGSLPATVDIGARGALLGIDLGEDWTQIANAAAHFADSLRSAPVTVHLEQDRLTLPRTGEGYVIAWPSGNQCWRQRIGNRTVETCAITIAR